MRCPVVVHLLLARLAASSLVFFGCDDKCSSGVVSVRLPDAHFRIENSELVVESRSPKFEVHHYGPGALHSQLSGVREGSLVVANPKDSEYGVVQELKYGALTEYWRYLFHAGEVAFGDMARTIKSLEPRMKVYLVAKSGTDATGYRAERVPLEYSDLSGLAFPGGDYSLADVALEDPFLDWARFVDCAHSDPVEAWTSTLDRALKLLGIVIWSMIAGRATKDRVLGLLRRLSGCSSAAGRVLLARENGASVQEAIQTIVSSAHPLLEAVRVAKKSLRNAPYLKALAVEVFYYVEKTLPGRVEMAHDAVGLQDVVRDSCKWIDWANVELPGSDAIKVIADRIEKDPEFRDDVWTVFVCLKYSVLDADMKEGLMKKGMEVCQKHQLQEAIPVLFMLSYGGWNWKKSGGFYQQLKSCQSVGAMFEEITGFVTGTKVHECQKQNYWRPYCERMPSSAPHFADHVLHALSRARVFEPPYCQCKYCTNWDMPKDVLFQCIGEGLSRPMGLPCDFRRVLSHLSYNDSSTGWITLGACIDSMRPGWHSQYTLNDAVAEFVLKNGPPLMRRTLAVWVHETKLGDRTMPELPNRTMLVELVKGVPEGSRLRGRFCSLWFNESGIGAAEVVARWMSANPDYSVLSRSSVNEVVCVLEDGAVAMSSCAFRDPNTVDSLMRYAGPRTVGDLSRTINSDHSHISVQISRQSSRVRVCRVVGNEPSNEWWTRSVILRWSPGRGVSLFQFDEDRNHTACFSADKTGPELLCIFKYSPYTSPNAVMARYRREAGTTEGTDIVRFVSDVVPIVHETGELDSLASSFGVELCLTEANKTNPVVRALNECFGGIPYVLRDVQTWEHMEWVLRELNGNLIVAFWVFGGQ